MALLTEDSVRSDQDIYENVSRTLSRSQTAEESDGWGSSEFESYEDTDSHHSGSPAKRKSKTKTGDGEEEEVAPSVPVRKESQEDKKPPSTPVSLRWSAS